MNTKDKETNQPVNPKENKEDKKMANYPTSDHKGVDTEPNPGSPSTGKQVSSALGRSKTQLPHSKTFITGTDDDGQAT